ncbi:carbohydrate esterase family 3 protein [Hypoxylon crocopeplum]|nr:carbohydrate esterase family 3 protein [Hypoxylon crocopeplum]
MAWVNLEKGLEPSSWTTRLAFLRTKKAIAAFVALGCVLVGVIVVIALAAKGTIHVGGSSEGSKSEEQIAGISSSSVLEVTSSQATVIGIFASVTSTASTISSTAISSTSTPVSTLTSSTLVSTTATSTSKSASTSTSTSSALSSSSSSESTKSTATPSATSSITISSTSDIPLRIMALGASIVKGETSPGYLGFRKPMRDELVGLGFTVNMVGSVRLGDFVDNDVEAYGGKKITEMQQYAKKAVPQTLPNVFVINLGTNNLLQNIDIDKVGQQMEVLIDYLLTASKQSTVILSTMLTNKVGDGSLEPEVLDMNQQYRDIMKSFEASGKSVVLAEMHPSEGVPGVPTADEIGPDGSHPTVAGYEKMGHIFVQAIQKAVDQGLLHEPVDNGTPADGEAERG